MTNTLSITGINSTPLKSKDVVKFRIKSDMNGNIKSAGFLNFTVPAFPDLITSMNAVYSQSSTRYVTYYDANNEYRVNGKYKTYPVSLNGNITASVRLSLLSTTKPLTLSNGDVIKFTASAASTLNPLNNKEYKVLAQTTSSKVIGSTTVPATSTMNGIDLLIQSGLVPTSGTISSTINSVKEITSRKAYYDVTARITGINSPIVNFANVENAVRDVLIFGYIVSSGPPGANARKILFKEPTTSESSYVYITNTSGVDIAPAYSVVSDMLGKIGKTITFEENDSVIKYDLYIYAAIARYKYIQDATGAFVWTGDWLQKDSNGKPIWKDVIKVSGR